MFEVAVCFAAMFFVANIVQDITKHMGISSALAIIVAVSTADNAVDGSFFTTIGYVFAVSLFSFFAWVAFGGAVFAKIDEMKERFISNEHDN